MTKGQALEKTKSEFVSVASHQLQTPLSNAVRMMPEGIGLGLYMTKAIIDGSGGSISVASNDGGGTTLQVRFPLSGMQPKAGSRPLSLQSTD